jgi:N-acetylmuramoyl-L-alanine amidase
MLVGFQRLTRLSWLVALSILPGTLFAGELTGIRLSSGPLATRIVLDLDAAASHSLFELTDPNRVVIDLPGVAASSSLHLPVPKGRVRSVRTGVRANGELRVVLDLNEPADSKSFMLEPEGPLGHRLVIDLSDRSQSSRPRTILSDVYTARDVVVVIDPGHGGHDPGANGFGVREKDVVLEISKRLAELVNREPGLNAVLVRDDDRYVEFEDRLRIARDARADLFLSIHADAVDDSRVRGATVYSIGDRRAANERANRVADRENSEPLIGGVKLSEMDDSLAQVLLRLSQDVSISKSITAGESFIEQLSRVTAVRKTTVDQGSFIVLTSPDIPSVLIETAYLTNRNDANNLKDPTFQNVIAHALLNGIRDYYRTNAPSDAYLARNPPPAQQGPIRHVIARGETLSEIAERYRISLRELRRSNELRGDVIRIGQVLTIPTL